MSLMWFSEWLEIDKKRKAKEKKNERSNSQSDQENRSIGYEGKTARDDTKEYTTVVYDFTQSKWEDYSGCIAPLFFHSKYRFLNHKATETNPTIIGTSTSGPITAANAAPELIPNTPIATAIANSKLLLAAVKDRVQHLL